MIIREYTEKDYENIKRLHALSRLDYTLPPSLSGNGFLAARVVEDDQGIGMACFFRRTAETYLIVNKSWKSPAWRNEAIRKLHYECNGALKKEGIVDAIAFIPPQIVESFGKRLEGFGWSKCRDDWKAYCMVVE